MRKMGSHVADQHPVILGVRSRDIQGANKCSSDPLAPDSTFLRGLKPQPPGAKTAAGFVTGERSEGEKRGLKIILSIKKKMKQKRNDHVNHVNPSQGKAEIQWCMPFVSILPLSTHYLAKVAICEGPCPAAEPSKPR